MPLIKCEINLMLTWLSTYVMTNSTGIGTFAIADAKLYVLFVCKTIATIEIRF